VEGVISERIGRLAPELREVLNAASVMGDEFTAEVVARTLKVDERRIIRQLGGVLERKHHLVRNTGSQRRGRQRLSHFRFQHILFQNYLYQNLNHSDRSYLHEDVGLALEDLYAGQTEAVALQLARHFQAAGIAGKAVIYLILAGEGSMRLSAYSEAAQHFNRALLFLAEMPESPERRQKEFTIQFNLGLIWDASKGVGSPESGEAYTQALALGRQLGEPQELAQVLYALAQHAQMRSELEQAQAYGEECFRLAADEQNPKLMVAANQSLWATAHMLGQHADAVAQSGQAIAYYRAQQPNLTIDDAFTLATILARAGLNLLPVGYPDRALEQAKEALTLMQSYEHSFGVAYCLAFLTYIHLLRGDWQEALQFSQECVKSANTYGFTQIRTMAELYQGVALARLGEAEAGIALVKKAIAEREAMEVTFGNQTALARLAEACGQAGRVSEGLALINGVLAHPDIINDHQYEPKLHQIKGDLLLLQDWAGNDPTTSRQEAEECFRRAVEIAHSQQAKLWEARALISLCRLLHSQSRDEGCRQQLAELYAWFTEGFETEDLWVVRAALQEMT
jgi:predicted ATPase